ncbi:MAG: sugar phosphate isomerase/epimerase family protein [bacterium]
MVKLSAFADEIATDLKEQMDVLEREGVKFIELRGVWGKNVLDLTDEELNKIKGMLEERGFGISSIGSPIGKVGIEDDFEAHLVRFRRALEIAKSLNSKYIRIFSFYIPRGKDPADYRGEVMRRMKAMADIAGKEGIMLLHENEKEIYGDTGARCKDILDTVNSPNLRAVFDPANFVQVGVRPYEECYPLLKDYIEYMHIKDALLGSGRVVPAGKGDGKLVEIFRELKGRGYDGFASLEPHLAIAGRSSGFTGAELFKTAIDAFREVLKTVGMDYER